MPEAMRDSSLPVASRFLRAGSQRCSHVETGDVRILRRLGAIWPIVTLSVQIQCGRVTKCYPSFIVWQCSGEVVAGIDKFDLPIVSLSLEKVTRDARDFTTAAGAVMLPVRIYPR
ncbi:hypothetical protein [[Erwinia] mediterraneensis]|uniref:hypothetical protein n=1 Tax=[Erwinia] mediterraneensis TaxID=2161819 RepID=UPI001030181F|nr:hypothetical protein [[Erwinia] mediterraneensis]